jgi:hypothetical protein
VFLLTPLEEAILRLFYNMLLLTSFGNTIT